MGLSLLEVVLSLAILGVACAFMAQSMQLATSNAIAAQRQAQAELAAESVMSEVVAGLIPIEPSSSWVPVSSTSSTSSWSYMLSTVPCEVQNMVGISVAVRDDSRVDGSDTPDMTVIRWIIDPVLGLDAPPTTDATGQAGASGQAAGATGTSGQSTGGLNGKM